MATSYEQGGDPAVVRRTLLRRGAKLAYVAPAIIAAMKVESAFAASGGDDKGKGKDKDKGR